MWAATFREYGGPEVMRWEQLDDPACGDDDVLVRVRACGVNHSDLDSRAGSSRWPFTMPWVLGAEFAGTVAAVGCDVQGIAEGDPVTAYQQFSCGTCSACGRWRQDLCERFIVYGTDRWGGYAELVQVPARAVHPAARRARLPDRGGRPVRGVDGLVDGRRPWPLSGRARRCWCRRRPAAWPAPPSRRRGSPVPG